MRSAIACITKCGLGGTCGSPESTLRQTSRAGSGCGFSIPTAANAATHVLAEKVERVRMFGSAALDLAFVADSRTDACVIFSNKPWDTAAGVLIARESGALATDALGANHSPSSSETIGASASIHGDLTTILR